MALLRYATYLIYLLVLTKVATATVCFNCKDIDNPGDCKAFNPCSDGQECYHEVVEAEDGSPKYSWGCASQQLCTLETSLSTRRKRLDVQKCFECCDTDFCNYGECQRDFCGSVTCQNNATCNNTPLRHYCNCTTGYTGIFCETEIDECSSSPCQNEANCTDYIGYYTCTCVPGFVGTNCEINTDECASSPCQYNSTCTDLVNGYTCDCIPGITGVNCEIDVDECASSPCQYNSTCTDQVNGYICDCIPGITGVNCEIDIDECANVVCQNGGTCQDLINGFQCLCQFGFTGQFCEQSLGRVCYSCENGIDDPYNCTNKVICGKEEECYTEHELVAVDVASYNLGCVARGMCTYVQNNLQARVGRRTTPIQLCYECCDVNGCNQRTCSDLRSQRLWTL